MAHWSDDKTAYFTLMTEGNLPNRCIPKYYKRPKIKLSNINEQVLYDWLENNPD